MSSPYNMLERFLCLCRLFSENFLDQPIRETMNVSRYFGLERPRGVDREAFESTVLVHLFRGYIGQGRCCTSNEQACSCKDWDEIFRAIMQNGMTEASDLRSKHNSTQKEASDLRLYNSIENFTRNFSPPKEGDYSGMTSLQEPRQEMIPATHLLDRPFMIERGLDVHPSASPAWLGGNCNELTSLYSTLTDGNPATESHKLFEQFVKQLHCIPFVQSHEGNELKITPIWSENVRPENFDLDPHSLQALRRRSWPDSMKSAFNVSMDMMENRNDISGPKTVFILLAIPWNDAREQWGDTAIPAHLCRWFSLDGTEFPFTLKNEHRYDRRGMA